MSFLLSVLVATLATASPLGSQLVTKQALAAVPEGWELKTTAPTNYQLNLHIRLKEENLDQLQERLLQVSDPDHPKYGQHMSKAEVEALTAPTKQTIDSVSQWLSSHGIDAGDVNSGFISVKMSVKDARKVLNANYSLYAHPATGRQTVRTTSYSLPQHLHEAIAMIQPTTLFSDLGMSKKNFIKPVPESALTGHNARAASSICSQQGSSTGCLRENYNVKGYTPTGGKTTLGITGFLGEVPSTADLSSYIRKYDSDIPSNTTFTLKSINNGPTEAGGVGEADLDVQIAVPLTYPIENVFYSTGGSPPTNGNVSDNEPYLDWLKYTLALENPSQTYSISYGDDERSVPSDYAEAVCTQFMKLGARGVSVLTASGDSGVGGREVCQPGTSKIKKFLPEFPGSCPWVTVVGGTIHYGADEAAEHDGGGGFSNHFGTPAYQADAVKAYIESLGGKFKGAYNASGRAYPDLAAAYREFPIFSGGSEGRSGGTSASTPTVASIIALLNDYLVSSGKAPLGFLNPFIYKKRGAGLRDIAIGHNNACGSVSAFPATKGWDAATGWGVPDFVKFKGLI